MKTLVSLGHFFGGGDSGSEFSIAVVQKSILLKGDIPSSIKKSHRNSEPM